MVMILTGATSYLGKNFIKSFKKTDDLLCFVRKKSPEIKARQEIVNFNEKKSFDGFVNKNDVVVHIAGITDGTKKELFDVNYKITKNLVDVAKKKKARRFIFISSAIVEMEEKGDYGESKLKAEEYIKKSGIEFIILRPSLIYGKGEKKFIGKIIYFINKYRIVPVIGNGKYSIRTVYAGDAVKIIEKSIYLKKRNKVYYVSSKDEISVNERYKIIGELMKKRFLVFHVPIFFLKIASLFIRIFKKDFPSIQQLTRITKHEDYDVDNTEKDFKIKFKDFKEGIGESL
ncbi:MAG: NAD-dependent epimerase/dehydratase family protein [Nanoarchaeota archaeon]|nr:NAD-dependent epimerase/dehydratase family protein [Nanoarchaeota archaeon]